MKIKNIVFDFDGVIYDSKKYHLDKINQIFKINLTPEEFAETHHGNVNIEMDNNNKMKKIDWKIYHQEIRKDFPKIKIDEKIKNKLIELAKKYNLFINSSAHNKPVIEFLKKNNIYNLFKKTLFREDHHLKGPKFKILEEEFNISPENTIFITDSTGDIYEAHEVGYKSIGITTGVHYRDELERLKPLVVIDDLEELNDILKKI